MSNVNLYILLVDATNDSLNLSVTVTPVETQARQSPCREHKALDCYYCSGFLLLLYIYVMLFSITDVF